MTLVRACLRVRKDRESSFRDCGVSEHRVQACLSSGEVGQTHFNYYAGLVKLVQAHFSVRIDRVSSFQHCGSLVKLVQACLIAKKNRETVSITVELLSNLCKPV